MITLLGAVQVRLATVGELAFAAVTVCVACWDLLVAARLVRGWWRGRKEAA